MSATPETDSAQHEGLLRGNAVPTHVVHVDFARKLERERDEAREAFKISYNERVQMELERNEARESRNKWEKAAFDLYALCEERRGK